MQRISTTAIVVVGGDGRFPDTLAGAQNVRLYPADPNLDALGRAVDAWSEARRTRSTYFVYDADPLAAIESAWASHYRGGSSPGELEVTLAETLRRWRAGSIELPDYYVCLDPDRFDPIERHFYLGVLAGAAPMRVVVTTPGRVADALAHLRSDRWWPPLDVLVRDLDRSVPDLVGLAPDAQEDDARGLIV